MQSRLYEVIESALQGRGGGTVDDILDYMPIKGNIFDDLIDIVNLIYAYKCQDMGGYDLLSFSGFKKRLVDKIYQERGEDGRGLISKVMKYGKNI